MQFLGFLYQYIYLKAQYEHESLDLSLKRFCAAVRLAYHPPPPPFPLSLIYRTIYTPNWRLDSLLALFQASWREQELNVREPQVGGGGGGMPIKIWREGEG
jgi:hypothetical protein